MILLRPNWLPIIALAAAGALGTGLALAQTDTQGVAEAARAAVEEAWRKEVQPFIESGLNRIEIHTVERRNRLARDVYLVHAFAEASWWKHSRHYLLLLRPAAAGYEVLYRFAGGAGGGGVRYRLVDLGATARRFALEISDHGREEGAGTWTIVVLYLPAGDRFAEVFRQLTTYHPPAPHGYASTLSYRRAEGPIREIVLHTELLKAQVRVDQVESVFAWQEESYLGVLPLPDAWRAELPARIRQPAKPLE